MKDKKFDAVQVWKDLEDVLAPRLRLNLIDRAVYAHLLRHTRLEGKPRLQFSIPWLTAKVSVSKGPVRAAIRRLAAHGALRLIERNYGGHLVEVRLPCEVRAARRKKGTRGRTGPPAGINIDLLDFLRSPQLRCAIHAREGGQCFYCLRRVPPRSRCLDHVVPRAKSGQNSYRNLVSCCPECNWQKKDRPAPDFLREIYREGRLSHEDLSARLRAVRALAAGKLRPRVSTGADASERA